MKKFIPLLVAASIFAGCSDAAPAAQPTVYAETPDTTEPPVVTSAPASSAAVTTAVTAAKKAENPFGRFSVTEEYFNRITDDDVRKIYYSGLRTEDFVDDFYVLPWRDEMYRIVYVPESKEYDGWVRRIPDTDPQPVSTTMIEENDLYTAYREDYDNGDQLIWLKPRDLKLIWDQDKRFVGEYDTDRIEQDIDLLRQQEYIIIAREVQKRDNGYVYGYFAINKDAHSSAIELTWREYFLNEKTNVLTKQAVLVKGRRVSDTLSNDHGASAPDPHFDNRVKQTEVLPVSIEEPVISNASANVPVAVKKKVEKEAPNPYDDKSALTDIKLSAARRYIMTDDEGEGKCGKGEGIFYAEIAKDADRPDRIEFIDIESGEIVGYMYDDGNFEEHGDDTADDGIYSIRLRYDLDIDTDPDVSETWSQCYYTRYNDADGAKHICQVPEGINVQEHVTEKELSDWDVVQDRIAEITSSEEYKNATTDEKEAMLLSELDKLADEGLVYRELTRTNSTPRNVVYKIVKGPTVVVELEPCACGYGFGYDMTVEDSVSLTE